MRLKLFLFSFPYFISPLSIHSYQNLNLNINGSKLLIGIDFEGKRYFVIENRMNHYCTEHFDSTSQQKHSLDFNALPKTKDSPHTFFQIKSTKKHLKWLWQGL